MRPKDFREKDSSNQFAFEKLTPTEFETFVERLLWALKFQNVQRLGGTGDKGKDFSATMMSDLTGVTPTQRHWVIQCKRSVRVRIADIDKELANFRSSPPDGWILCTTSNGTPALREWVSRLTEKKTWPFEIQAWWRDTLERVTHEHRTELIGSLPPLLLAKVNITSSQAGCHRDIPTAVARLRSRVHEQIARYARSKYIPALYVDRALQKALVDFHATETDLSRRFFVSTEKILTDAEEALKRVLLHFESLDSPSGGTLQNADLARVWCNFKLDLTESSRSAVDQLNASTAAIREKLAGISKNLASSLPGVDDLRDDISHLRECINDAPQLPLPRLLDHRPEAEHLSPILWSAISYPDCPDSLSRYCDLFITEIDIVTRPALLIVDRAGGGKTNLLCHVGIKLSQTNPTILLFGKQVDANKDSLLVELKRALCIAFGVTEESAIEDVHTVLNGSGRMVHVLIDGINEARDVQMMDTAIKTLLERLRFLRYRVSVTCRDIYWQFFNSSKWVFFVQQIHTDGLKAFNDSEYSYALPLYLAHFHLRCDLGGDALEQCRHPLLLRFFCEAYGSVEGENVNLGSVPDIRLKELFDEYIARKAEQIRETLHHANTNNIIGFLFRLVNYFFANSLSSLPTTEIGIATGEGDLSSERSVYLALLDEDIILEERPATAPNIRYVSFVYEAFMEYLVAKAILTYPEIYRLDSEQAIVSRLEEVSERWINAQGVAEFLGVMLFAGETGKEQLRPVAFATALARGSALWRPVFWSIIGKLDPVQLTPRLCDLVPEALLSGSGVSMVKEALRLVNRASGFTAHRLAGVLMWSAIFMPMTLRWSDLRTISDAGVAELERICQRLLAEKKSQKGHVGSIDAATVFNAALPFLNAPVRRLIRAKMRKLGKPTVGALPFAILKLMWDAFPDLQVLAINGVLHWSPEGALNCARLLGSSKHPKQTSKLLRLFGSRCENRDIGLWLSA